MGGLVAFPVFVLLFAMTRSLAASMLALAGTGLCLVAVYNLCNSLIQTLVEDRLRGRVMAFYTLVFMGLLPVGSLVAGQVAHAVGTVTTVMVCAVVLWIGAPRLRRLE